MAEVIQWIAYPNQSLRKRKAWGRGSALVTRVGAGRRSWRGSGWVGGLVWFDEPGRDSGGSGSPVEPGSGSRRLRRRTARQAAAVGRRKEPGGRKFVFQGCFGSWESV
ncbi:hypothetical protein HPP92_016567 [Vanilla planifolia]|uniref:Uncharacterized protein n=1 Tax=Vanilla planifolia TaxID=51239 RepID=A0A835QIX9_VANPL|nr:hypothetical protein HPP92_017159 [Vanilla planifolia]KAG0472021.1 hypothetical protein HPP92_016567 [Vanilla planifolia]